jgi:serine/threonine protein kinase
MNPGTIISHYRVVGQLGQGGMGIVYKAEDTKLDRTVALKLLPPHALASEDDRARFYREARAAAALNHPNIAHVYEIDESDVEGEGKRPFIAMEYIDGESLAERIAKGPLPLQDAISIAAQVADGLKAAHEKDIVHRDVKSGNIMLTSAGVPKILDFGLAKTAASTKLTQMGSTLGTVAYMSPEQARGEEVDRRSDVWSLGVILYEMVSGRMPFLGDYEQATIYGILNACRARAADGRSYWRPDGDRTHRQQVHDEGCGAALRFGCGSDRRSPPCGDESELYDHDRIGYDRAANRGNVHRVGCRRAELDRSAGYQISKPWLAVAGAGTRARICPRMASVREG